jgi:hypothetical protein
MKKFLVLWLVLAAFAGASCKGSANDCDDAGAPVPYVGYVPSPCAIGELNFYCIVHVHPLEICGCDPWEVPVRQCGFTSQDAANRLMNIMLGGPYKEVAVRCGLDPNMDFSDPLKGRPTPMLPPGPPKKPMGFDPGFDPQADGPDADACTACVLGACPFDYDGCSASAICSCWVACVGGCEPGTSCDCSACGTPDDVTERLGTCTRDPDLCGGLCLPKDATCTAVACGKSECSSKSKASSSSSSSGSTSTLLPYGASCISGDQCQSGTCAPSPINACN